MGFLGCFGGSSNKSQPKSSLQEPPPVAPPSPSKKNQHLDTAVQLKEVRGRRG